MSGGSFMEFFIILLQSYFGFQFSAHSSDFKYPKLVSDVIIFPTKNDAISDMGRA